MPALSWVAIESGLENDPKFLSFARALKIKRETALWYVYRWRVLVFQQAFQFTGCLPKRYTAIDIASFLSFRGDPRRLVEAMKSAGLIGYKKGRGFVYPGWTETVTGGYAARREEERVRKVREREERKANTLSVRGPASVVRGSSNDGSVYGPRIVQGHPEERNETTADGAPPDPPPGGGASLADIRWDWLASHAPTLQNRTACKRMLATMSESDWALVQLAYGHLHQAGSSISVRNRRALYAPTDVFLRKQAYLRFRVAERPKKKPARESGTASVVSLAEELEKRLAAGDAFVIEFLRDPDQTEEAKESTKRRWSALPENAGRRPPWESMGGGVIQHEVAS